MVNIYYNAWQEKYKQPFGAIPIKQTVHFNINVSDFAKAKVYLVIREEDSAKGAETFMMNQLEEDLFHFCYRLGEQAGLYFYYFKIDLINENNQVSTYYCSYGEDGGAGKIYDSKNQMPEYQLTCYETAEIAPDWYQQAVFYQIFPDRFNNGNENGQVNAPKKNSFIYGTKEDTPMYIRNEKNEILRWDFYGGNLKGIQAKIPYLLELGINALYLNPIFEATSNHRYDTNDYFKIDPMLGTEKDFVELLDALHQVGIHIILDGVFSHVGRNSRYFNQAGIYGEEVGASRNQQSPYYSWFQFTKYPDEYRSWWGVADLPEVNKENPSFQSFIYGPKGVIDKWTALGVDGWRLDVADELTDDFIGGIRQRLNTFKNKILIGEVWEDASNKIAYEKRRKYLFGNHLQSVMNYPLRQQILDILTMQKKMSQITKEMVEIQANYPKDFYYNQLNNLGTHDTERIFTMLNQSEDDLDVAWGLLFVMPGIPCVYYGDEAGVTGGTDPDNRKYFPWNHVNPTIYQDCHKWIKRRKTHSSLMNGEFYPFYTETEDVFGVLRFNQEEYSAYIVNRGENDKVLRLTDLINPRQFNGNLSILEKLFSEKVIEGHANLFLSIRI
ncbi:glycoside hydrolase family 13 protein [Enterococcus sp. AZ103]|uniref:glycoside hydrolase family 13 protein n=1 Tax=Enterococcus sp. AZ103 TaxID=2774628 RepID=UPI003F214651